jgi:hypothetical protein
MNAVKTNDDSVEKRQAKEIKFHLDIITHYDPTYVYVICRSNDGENTSIKVPTKRGVPIGGYVYDAANESYLLQGVDMLPLGIIPVSLRVTMRGCENWAVDMPIPEVILKRYLSTQQKNLLKSFQSKWIGENFTFEFVQFLSAN